MEHNLFKMAQKYYIDTSIWRDYNENRSDRFRPLGEWAFALFRHIKENKELALYSDLVLDELKIRYSEKEVNEIFKILSDEGLLKKVDDPTKEQVKEAKKKSKELKIPFADALHAILARDNKSILVSRDIHFHELQKIVKIKKPEDII